MPGLPSTADRVVRVRADDRFLRLRSTFSPFDGIIEVIRDGEIVTSWSTEEQRHPLDIAVGDDFVYILSISTTAIPTALMLDIYEL
ncbi:MAG: hypothetical protein HN420_05620 [Rhodospirillaceae bacterium]|jgi:hypothetical protein|nr:hypothetical protein [Rhodospirillaceae bacterium]